MRLYNAFRCLTKFIARALGIFYKLKKTDAEIRKINQTRSQVLSVDSVERVNERLDKG